MRGDFVEVRQNLSARPRRMKGHELDGSGSEQEQMAASCGCGNENPGSKKCGKFLDYLRSCYVLRTEYTAWSR